jgi:hypothetical protein
MNKFVVFLGVGAIQPARMGKAGFSDTGRGLDRGQPVVGRRLK